LPSPRLVGEPRPMMGFPRQVGVPYFGIVGDGWGDD
jgi:hypothetical protein